MFNYKKLIEMEWTKSIPPIFSSKVENILLK